MTTIILFCRTCNIHREYDECKPTTFCERCGLTMDVVKEPVDLYMDGFHNSLAKVRCEEIILKEYVKFLIKSGVENLFNKFPSLIFRMIGKTEGLRIARLLEETGGCVSLRYSLPDNSELPKEMFKDEIKAMVLVVDDNDSIRNTIFEILEENGFDVITAIDGIDALIKAMTITFDLVILDINMPKMDGLTFLNLLRVDPRTKNVPVLILTINATEDTILQATRHGLTGYIVKPFKPKELLDRVVSIVKGWV